MEKDDTTLTVQRGRESWNYIYVMLGFVLAIEGAIIQMAASFPCNLIVFIAFGVSTVWLFIFSERFQNWLLDLRSNYEKGRPH